MTGDFVAEVYAFEGVEPKQVEYFADFAATKEFAEAFNQHRGSDYLRVHLPASAKDGALWAIQLAILGVRLV
jgi:hypothetical protein